MFSLCFVFHENKSLLFVDLWHSYGPYDKAACYEFPCFKAHSLTLFLPALILNGTHVSIKPDVMTSLKKNYFAGYIHNSNSLIIFVVFRFTLSSF